MGETALSPGYHALPPGMLANVVTCLEMTARPAVSAGLPAGYSLRPLARDDLAGFRALFSKVGRDWMWFSRLLMADEKLAGILGDAKVESFALQDGGQDVGILELDFRGQPDCELSFFGLTKDAIGTGLGRALMNEALARAWARPIARLWVHTCTFDHPAALGFYRRSGFAPYKMMVEVHDDPRVSGKMPRDASPHVPLLP